MNEIPFAQVLKQVGLHRLRDVVAFFEYRAKKTAVANWTAGTRNPPQWAVDLLLEALHTRQARELETASRLKAGPGRLAGLRPQPRNLAAWRAAQNR